MVVKDVYEACRTISCFPDQARNFELITDAVEILNNKADFDISLGYLDMPVPANGMLTLPREVKSPINVNIDDNPSFSRDRLYEFTLNGPGSNTERIGWSWEDKGNVSTFVAITTPSQIYAICNDAADAGKKLIVWGRIASGEEVREELILSLIHLTDSVNTFVSITRIAKDITIGTVNLFTSATVLLSTYSPDETEPSYRQIKISKTSGTAHIYFKRNSFVVSSMYDFIPLRSKRALLYMIKALKWYSSDNTELGDKFEATAVKFANDENKSHNSFIELANATQIQTIRNLNINNRDSVIFADVVDDFSRIFGFIGIDKLMDKATEAVELLANKNASWDGLVGWVDILTDQFHFVTLPRYVETILAININSRPSEFRNQWFQYHLNGPGSSWQSCLAPQDAGETVTFRDVNYPLNLVAIPDLSSDNDTEMRGYGYFQGKRIMTIDSQGVMQDGFPITCNVSGATNSTQFVDRIERITKAQSNGFIKLLGFDATRNLEVVVGYYEPDESEPKYRRMRLHETAATVRLKYRKRTLKVTSLTTPLHLKSRQAIIRMATALNFMDKKDYPSADVEMKLAESMLMDEQRSSNPLDNPQIQFSDTTQYYQT